MRIVLIRHFRVGFKWRVFYNSREFEADHAGYNSAAVVKIPVQIKQKSRVIASTMGRALETAKFIFSRDPDVSDESLVEVPLKPFVKTRLRLPKLMWDVVGRLQWRLNSRRQPEQYRESKHRVHRFLNSIIEQREDVVIVCHGWIIKLMIGKLIKEGFQGPRPIYIRNGHPYEYVLPLRKLRKKHTPD